VQIDGSVFLRKSVTYFPNYTASHPRSACSLDTHGHENAKFVFIEQVTTIVVLEFDLEIIPGN
jgi:hypothetical protein